MIIKWLTYKLQRLARHFYWLFRLSRARIGKGVRISFPVRVEGQGRLVIGDRAQIGRNVYFGIGQGGEIKIGSGCRIDQGAEIIAGPGAQIILGDNCWVMKGTVIRARQGKFVFGKQVNIATYVQIFSREQEVEGNLSVGDGSHINDYAMLDMADDLSLGKEVAVGQFSIIFTHDHDYSDPVKPAWKGGIETKPVHIQDGAWIGAKVIILHGVSVGERTVIASAAVVTKDCPAETICAGVPAKVIKKINSKK